MSPTNWFRSRSKKSSQQPARRPRTRPGVERLEDRAVPAVIPALHSNPGAPATLYLDFDGHFEATWGSYSNITTPVFNQDGDASSFSDTEVEAIRAVWARAAEDYAPFNINVTTVEPAELAPGVPAATANGKALRVSIGGNSSWMGANYGGFAYINSFTSSTPNVCFVFDSSNKATTRWMGDTVSHEAGHSFGLLHQSTFDPNGDETSEYNYGNASWAPLMGATIYPTSVTTWHNGTTTSATTFQDDLAILAGTTNGFGYRPDDHGNTTGSATPLAVSGATWGGAGVIATSTDVDYFSFTVTATDTYRIAAAGPGADANLDAVIELRNGTGQVVEAAAPATTIDAKIVRSLTPGTYTIAVKSTGAYGWVGSYTVGIDAPPAGITVTPTSTVLTTGEDGRSTSFTVVLETQPLADVLIPISSTSPGEGTVSTSSLVFTAANWNVPQTVTITGVADGVVDGDAAYGVVLGPATSTDAEYAGLDVADLAVVNVDNDEPGFLYFTDSTNDTIARARLNGAYGETLIDLNDNFSGDPAPVGLAIDAASGKVYWIDRAALGIYRANLDGSAAERVLTVTGSPGKLALDTAAGKMYWTDSSAKSIRRANLDGSSVEVLMTGTLAPAGLALDATGGKMYWTENTSGGTVIGSVRRANLDGSNAETLWTGSGLSGSTALALDTTVGKVYWADYNADRIYRANLDGSGVEVVVDTGAVAPGSDVHGLTVDVPGGKIYWQDFATKTLYRANLDGSMVVGLVTVTRSNGLAVARLAPGVSVTNRTGLVTTEGGSGSSFRVVLTTKPAANVTIPVSSGDTTEGTVSVASLTFTPDNWYIPQTVTISSVEDAAIDGNVPHTIVLGTTSSADPVYHGLNPADASVTSVDNDVTKFFVADDAGTDRTYRYGAPVNSLSNSALNSGNTAPRGAASTVVGDKVWVVDANKKVYVYSATGTLLGSWSANSLDKNATVEGITVYGNDVWIVDARLDRVYRYANAASRLSGSQNATSNFALDATNRSPKDLVTDGTHIWVVNDLVLDKVFKYTVSGTFVGSWAIDPANGSPTGITLDPANPRHLWIVDNGTDRVYQYNDAVSRTSGSQAAAVSYALAAGNTNPQGIADPPAPPRSAGGRKLERPRAVAEVVPFAAGSAGSTLSGRGYEGKSGLDPTLFAYFDRNRISALDLFFSELRRS